MQFDIPVIQLWPMQATWVTLLWYATVPRPDMLAQLHASGQLQSLLLKYMQDAYQRIQQAAAQVIACCMSQNTLWCDDVRCAISHTCTELFCCSCCLCSNLRDL